MSNIDFIRLNNAIDSLMLSSKKLNIKNDVFDDVANTGMMMSNGLYINKVADDAPIKTEEKIHQIDVEAIRNAIKSAVEKRNIKKNKIELNEIKVSPMGYMDNNKNAISVEPVLSYKIDSKHNLSVKDILKMLEYGSYNKKYLFDGERPFVIYNSNHNAISSTIYAAGLIDVMHIMQNNVFFRNNVHFSPYCKHVKKMSDNDYKIAYGNSFEIECFENITTVKQMPLCDECCNILNIPNLAEHSDFIAMFGLVVSISVDSTNI